MRIEQLHAARMIHVTDVQPGDLIDTQGWWTEDAPEAMAAEYEMFEVAGIEIETDDVVRINFENWDSFGYPINEPIVVQRRYNS